MAFQGHVNGQLPKKKRKITDASGWTHVVHGRGNVVNVAKLNTQSRTLQVLDCMPLDQVMESHARCLEKWEHSDCWTACMEILDKFSDACNHLRLTNCVCLGLGSLSSGRDSSRHELAALISILNLLGKTHTIKDVLFQDPVFNDVDKALLTKLGYRVVSSPLGFESIGRNTFCFAPHLENELLAEALKSAHPALCVGNSDIVADRPFHSSARASERTLDIFRRFLRATESYKMPQYERDSWCHFTSIYWLRDDPG